jgi:hypothetical protein
MNCLFDYVIDVHEREHHAPLQLQEFRYTGVRVRRTRQISKGPQDPTDFKGSAGPDSL